MYIVNVVVLKTETTITSGCVKSFIRVFPKWLSLNSVNSLTIYFVKSESHTETSSIRNRDDTTVP